MVRVAINGFGRIGRNFLRTILADSNVHKTIEVVVINIGPARPDLLAYMFRYDTIMGTYPEKVTYEHNLLTIGEHTIHIVASTDTTSLPWKAYNIDWVVDCSGVGTQREKAQEHIAAGARRVLISAPAHDEDITIVMGVNEDQFDANKHAIVSLGSCTTNAMIPLLKVVHDTCGIVQGFMTTTHAYTNSQVLLDVEGDSARTSRAAALNIIPSTTGASRVLGKIMPHLEQIIACSSVRVPVAKVSLLEIVFLAQNTVSVDLLHAALHAAAQQRMQGILVITNEPLVSSDLSGNPHSVVVDALLTDVRGPLAKVVGWYDNEWAYSVRLKDFLVHSSLGQ